MDIGLALSGHTVRVLEKCPRLGNPPGGIPLTPHVTKILEQWGLEDELRKGGFLVREGPHLWDCKSADRAYTPIAPFCPVLSFLVSAHVANRLPSRDR